MRTRLFIAPIALLLTAGIYPARAQEEPGKIVDQYVKATGGGRALAKIQTLTLEGNFTSEEGKARTYPPDTKPANRYFLELVGRGKDPVRAYNGKSAWHENG